MRPQLSVHSNSPDPRELPEIPLATERHLAALQALNCAFEQEHPVTIMVGEGKHEFSHIISAFLHGLSGQATVARLRQPYDESLIAMREINRALGFDPKNLALPDLKNILTMFLEYQQQHKQRTVLLIEHAEEQGLWLLDCIAKLAGSEVAGPGGLMIILAGRSRLEELLKMSSFEVIKKNAGRIIELAPFNFSETKDFIAQRSHSLGVGDIHKLYAFEAVDQLHKLSGGIPNNVAQLCQECLHLSEGGKRGAVTAKMVVKAARQLQLKSANDIRLSVVGKYSEPATITTEARLVVRHKGVIVQDIEVKCGRFLIGREKTADIRLPCSLVSRRHAVLLRTDTSMQISDLDSKNGTYVEGRSITEHDLAPGTAFSLGHCEIEIVAE